MTAPDWTGLAEQLGTITRTASGYSERGGTDVAREALIEVLGEQLIGSCLDHYLAGGLGSELTRSILRELRPSTAMDRCMELYRTSSDRELGRKAVFALGDFADGHALQWYSELWASDDEVVRYSAVRLIDRLYMTGDLEPEDAINILQEARVDRDHNVLKYTEETIEMLQADIASREMRESLHE